MAIDIGAAATNRAGGGVGTRVAKDNPANADGTLDTVELWAELGISGTIEAATFIHEGGNVLSTRDSEVLGSATPAGYYPFTGLSIDVVAGDYIGAYIPDSSLSHDTTGGSGYWYLAGDNIPCSSATFISSSDYVLSLYGTGTEAGGGVTYEESCIDFIKLVDAPSVGVIFNPSVTDGVRLQDSPVSQASLQVQAQDAVKLKDSVWGGLIYDILAQDYVKLLDGTTVNLCEYYNTGDDGYSAHYGVYWHGQTFTPSVDHKIASVKLLLYRVGSPGTVTVSIRATDVNGHPTGADLCSGTIDGNSLTTDTAGVWYEITLGAGYALGAGTKYAIVARTPSGNSSNYSCWRRNGSLPTYTGGALEVSTDSGSSWTTYTGIDYMFEEYTAFSSPSIFLTIPLNATDTIKLKDSVTAGLLFNVLVSSGIKLKDSPSAQLRMYVSLADGIKLKDSTLAQMTLQALASDGIKLKDSALTDLIARIVYEFLVGVKVIGEYGAKLTGEEAAKVIEEYAHKLIEEAKNKFTEETGDKFIEKQ